MLDAMENTGAAALEMLVLTSSFSSLMLFASRVKSNLAGAPIPTLVSVGELGGGHLLLPEEGPVAHEKCGVVAGRHGRKDGGRAGGLLGDGAEGVELHRHGRSLDHGRIVRQELTLDGCGGQGCKKRG
jgi:hypothetical protein